ncbi:hypothetical protein TESG_05641 [Trichophyton tonsurans CBS 112818]|uniref:Uncharacterized protein n=2 Tax=Trichophyton TaxID=5550 RepID=F2PMU8_TRIEC|nr:hypothetical protein TESG_05641 [Trichophyton tonsurans CBS 112818]EGE03216.1 hypothetical protein TEQG_02254 [Trichophyton equinum CBS 127.97]
MATAGGATHPHPQRSKAHRHQGRCVGSWQAALSRTMTQLSSPPFGMANRSENLDSKGDGGTVRSVTVASGYATLAPSPWKSRFKMIRTAVWEPASCPIPVPGTQGLAHFNYLDLKVVAEARQDTRHG